MTRYLLAQAFTLSVLLLHVVHAAVVINTWPFTHATAKAFAQLTSKYPLTPINDRAPIFPRHAALDAITAGCHQCEIEQCDFTVGYGGSPDSNGETTLDAMILDGGPSRAMGAVGQLRSIKNAIGVARAVMYHSAHSLLVGDGARDFGIMMGFQSSSLETDYSRQLHTDWKSKHCQPNYFRNVLHQDSTCPPYKPTTFQSDENEQEISSALLLTNRTNHDTIGMVVLDDGGNMAAGTSSNGANHKIAGRVGDAAIPGAGAYVDSTAGGAAATGDGDVMMRFLPTLHAVQYMATGIHPQVACELALARIGKAYPNFKGALVCLNNRGDIGAAAHGWQFAYSVQATGMTQPQVRHVDPMTYT